MSALVSFTDVPTVKPMLRIAPTVTTDDGLLRLLCDTCNMALAKALQRNILSAAYTETRDGTGTATLMLRNSPVTAVASVTLLGAPPLPSATPEALTPGVDYAFTRYALKRYAGVWPRGIQNVQVSYTAGYATIPPDLTHAATRLVAVRYRELERLGQKSKSMGGEVVSFDLAEMPPDVLAIVNRYTVAMPLTADLAGAL